MKTLSIIEGAYRATMEEQDDTIVWLHGAMKGAGADVAVLLRGNAVAFGEWRQTQPPRIAGDLTALIGKGVEICYVAEDMADRGIAQAQIIPGVQPVPRDAVAGLIGRFDRVWYW
jgi:intracellular sulfur oxidation DsrE/DsrF family protein